MITNCPALFAAVATVEAKMQDQDGFLTLAEAVALRAERGAYKVGL